LRIKGITFTFGEKISSFLVFRQTHSHPVEKLKSCLLNKQRKQ